MLSKIITKNNRLNEMIEDIQSEIVNDLDSLVKNKDNIEGDPETKMYNLINLYLQKADFMVEPFFPPQDEYFKIVTGLNKNADELLAYYKDKIK